MIPPHEIIPILESEWGWMAVLLFLAYEIGWPDHELLWDTKFQQYLTAIERRIGEVEKKQVAEIQVIRALAREERSIDTDAVDEYLVENGVEPDHFIRDEDD